MPSNSKWPDFTSARALISRTAGLGKQSPPLDPDLAEEDNDRRRRQARSKHHTERDNKRNSRADSPGRESEHKEESSNVIETLADSSDDMATDNQDGGSGSPLPAADTSQMDFGPLEMFDSLPAEPSSTQDHEDGNEAPEAVMSADTPSRTKKSKRDGKKKKKAKRHSGVDESAYDIEDNEEVEDVPVVADDATEEVGAGDAVSASAKSKRKRDSSDSAAGRKRKNRKSHKKHARIDEDEPAADDSDNEAGDEEALAEGGARYAQGELDETSTIELEKAAREAWAQHMNGSKDQAEEANEENDEADVSMGDAGQAVEDDAAADGQDVTETPRPKRASGRKKAKPTFFDQPQELIDAANELPSPTAATPKPRRRKTATKKAKKPKLIDGMMGDDSPSKKNSDSRSPAIKRDRMAGYTQGRFTEDEIARIDKQIKSFAEEHELTQWQVNDVGHLGK